ncbi:MAG: hypothetical protein ACLFNQ_10430 [Spirochaetaceae bacterium]
MRYRTPQHRVYLAARDTDPVTLQNTVLTTPDVDLAVVLSDLDEDEAAFVLSAAGRQKRVRVLDQREKLKRVRVSYQDLTTVQDRFMSRLAGNPAVSSRRYFRPSRR